MPGTREVLRAEALFASTLQSSQSPTPDEVRRAVAVRLRQLGIHGCEAEVAHEFGEHPDAAASRMCWALATVRRAYPAQRGRHSRRGSGPLAMAG